MNGNKKIEKWLSGNRNKQFNIVVGGHIFGGRYGESPQTPKSFEITDEGLSINFNTTEKLTIKKPRIIIAFFSNIYILSANEVIFGWHCYGREQIPENWCEEAYTRRYLTINVTRKGPITEALPEKENWKQKTLSFVALAKLM